jgi:hypothetical protein
LINADGVSYLSIARKYAAGRWGDAINGYWGPLLSWIMVPFIRAGLDPLLAAKIVSVILAMAALALLGRLMTQLEIRETEKTILLFSCIPLCLYMAFCMVTPDFLLVVVLLGYFGACLGWKPQHPWKGGLLLGFLGALAYWAKPYALFFILGHLLFWHAFLLWGWKKSRRDVIRSAAAGFAVFVILAGAWVGLISLKYGRFLMNSALKLNLAYLSPGSTGEPIHIDGLLRPPDSMAVSPWDDPTIIPEVHWNPLRSKSDFRYFLGLIWKNTKETARGLHHFTPLAALVLILTAVWGLARPQREAPFLFFAVSILGYSAGYLFLLVEERYIWIDLYLLLLAGGTLISRAPSRWLGRRAVSALLAVLLAGSFVLLPFSFFAHPGWVSTSNLGLHPEEITHIARVLQKRAPLHGLLASNHHWNESLFIAYFDHCQYAGEMKWEQDGLSLERDLKRLHVRYFLLWKVDDPKFVFLNKYIEVAHGAVKDLKVYRLKLRPSSEPYAYR